MKLNLSRECQKQVKSNIDKNVFTSYLNTDFVQDGMKTVRNQSQLSIDVESENNYEKRCDK